MAVIAYQDRLGCARRGYNVSRVLVWLVRVGVDFLEILLVEILAAREEALKRASGKAGPASPVGPCTGCDWAQIDKIV